MYAVCVLWSRCRDHTALVLFSVSTVLLVLLHRAQARAQANAPYTLTPPIMVRSQGAHGTVGL